MGETLEADYGPRLRAWRRAAAPVRGVAEDRVDVRPCLRPHQKGVVDLMSRQSLEKQDKESGPYREGHGGPLAA